MSYLLAFVMFALYVVTIYGDRMVDYAGGFISIIVLPYVTYDLLISSNTANEVWARAICVSMLFTLAFIRLLLRSVTSGGRIG